MTELPRVDVVILTWNDGELLDRAVGSALASYDVDVSVFVIDNGSDPPAEVSGDPRVQLVTNAENRGVAAGRNQGAALGTAPVICLLDSDATLGSHSLATLIAPLDDPSVGVTVPVFNAQEPEESAGRAPGLKVKLQRGLNRRTTYEAVPRCSDDLSWDVDFGIGACQVIRRSVFSAVGGLDDSIFYGPEDVDFCLRVITSGSRVIQVASADVDHPPRRAFRNPLSLRGLRHTRALVSYLWTHRHRSRGTTRQMLGRPSPRPPRS